MLQKIRIGAIIVTLGLLAGIGAYHLRLTEYPGEYSRPVSITVPENGVQSDAFSLRLFQLQVDDEQPSMIAPFLMGRALLSLAECSSGAQAEAIRQLQINPASEENHSVVPEMGILIAADISLPYTEKGNELPIMRLPFRENYPQALSLFNSTLQQMSGAANCAVDSRVLTPDTNLAVGICSTLRIKPQAPFYTKEQKEKLFYYADGSARTIDMMRQRAKLRYAAADDYSWEAVALLLKPTHARNGEPVVFIAIKPKELAGKFARRMTPEQLSSIRQALAETTPEDCALTLPVMQVGMSCNRLEQLPLPELQRLADPASDDWNFTTRRLGLDTLTEHCTFILEQTSEGSSPDNIDNAARSITFDTPFIWMVCDLTGPTPPYMMGIHQ